MKRFLYLAIVVAAAALVALPAIAQQDQTSAKKPDNPINEFKLGLINETLEKANFVLGDEFLPFPGFKTFDEANMPTASDVVLMLSHYIDGLNALRDKYVVDSRWNVTGDANVNEEFDD